MFEGISNISQIDQLDVPPGCNSLALAYHAGKRHLPILRSASSQELSPDGQWTNRIMTVNKLGDYLGKLGMRAGYGQRLYPYNFRRGQAQKLEGKACLIFSIP